MEDLTKLSHIFLENISDIDKKDRIIILTHVDSDGVSSGVLLYKVLTDKDYKNIDIIYPKKGENGYSERIKNLINSSKPDFLFFMDLGSYPLNFDNIRKIILIDHHKPEGIPNNGVLLSSFPPPPYISTSYLAYLLLKEINYNPKDYLGLIGEVGDYGLEVDAPYFKELIKKYKKKNISLVSSLINSARRVKEFDIKTSLKYLINSENFEDLLIDSEYMKKLLYYKDVIKEDVDKWKRTKPKFIKNIAIIEINSPNLIHPIIAQIWRNVLEKYIIICANFGYLKDKVSFSIRTNLDISLLSFLRKYLKPSIEEDLGFGHERATGGIIDLEKWFDLIKKIENDNIENNET